jgi:Ricin-type beta-trefoil lectin domain-like
MLKSRILKLAGITVTILRRKIRLPAVAVLGTLGITLGMALPAAAATAPHYSSRAADTSVAAVDVSADSADPFNFYNYNSQAAGHTLCLGISGGKDDAPAVQWPCNGHPDQIWHLGQEFGNGPYYQLINSDHQCLGVAGGSIAQGARVVGWTCEAGALNQYWAAGSESCGFYHPYYNLGAVLDGADMVLGVSGNRLQAGASVVIWGFQDRCNNQYWEP